MDILSDTIRRIFKLAIATSLIAPTTLQAGVSVIYPTNNANVLDGDADGIYETIASNPTTVSARHTDGVLTGKGVLAFDLAELEGRQFTVFDLSVRVTGYTSGTAHVSVTAYEDELDIDLDDATLAATFVGSYYPPGAGLNRVQIPLDNAIIQSTLESGTDLNLRIESDRSGTNTQIGGKKSLWPPYLIVGYLDYTKIHSINDGEILDSDGDGNFETVTSPATSLGIRTFSSLQEVSVSNFDISSTIDMAAERAYLHIRISSIANSTSQVSIYGFNDNLDVELEDATATGVLLGSYNPTAAGLGPYTIPLDTESLNPLLLGGGALTLRFSSEEPGANTQLNSLYLSDAPTLELELVPALPPGC
jgi:hypothetical protein